MKRAKIFTVTLTCTQGTVTKIISEKSEKPTLEEAQKFVGGYLQMCPVKVKSFDGPIQVMADEDGISKKLPLNPNATATVGYPILGNALILRGKACWD